METYVHLYISQFFLERKIFQTKVVDQIEKHIFFVKYILPKNRSFMTLCEKNVVEPDRTHMTIWHTPFLCWITKACKHTKIM
jgi:hypothetical protein